MENQLEIIKPEIDQVIARPVDVTDQESAAFVTETAVIAARLFNVLETHRKAEVTPLNNKVSEINGRYKSFTDRLKAIKTQASEAVTKWQDEQERKAAAERARIAREEEEQRQRELKAAEEKGREAPEVALAPLEEAPEVQKTVRSDTGSATGKKVWDHEVVNLAQVPVEYLQLDTVAVRKAINAGVREIPGVRIFQKSQLSVRSR